MIIETERLAIRPIEEGDYETWLQGFSNRLPSQHKYDEGKIDMSECTKEWFADLVQNYQQEAVRDTVYIFDIFHKENGSHIGTIDFSTLARADLQWARIGYTLHNQHWRQGYAKEAVTAALQLAFDELKFHRVEAHINLDNEASIQLAKSVGMEYECVRKGFLFENEEWTDHIIYYINAPK
jgi:[ribosomal protein S5]-alanine N-acetyltransferase